MTPILQILSVCEKPRMVQEEVLTYDLMKTFLYVRLYNTRMHSSRMRTTRSSESVCLSACWVIPPRGVGLETPSGQTPQLPPWVWAWRPARHAGIPPSPPPETCCKACWDTTCNAFWDTYTPCEQNHRHV